MKERLHISKKAHLILPTHRILDRVAKNIVAAGLASKCEVQVAYAIGVAKPVSIMVDTLAPARSLTTRSSRLWRRSLT